MAFPSLPLYHLDPPPNWAHQQPNQFQQHDPVVIPTQNPQIPPRPPPTTVGGGGGGSSTRTVSMADRARLAKISQPDQGALKCPRCESMNTKFCYYNNYSLSQPRHFCKTCRRYWTRGGALRNVPVGGGCRRKTKRSSNKTKSKSPKQSASASANNNSSSSFCPSHPHHLHYSSQLLFPPPPPTITTNDVVSGGIIGNHIHNVINGGSSISMLSSSSNGFVLPSLPHHHHQQFPTFFTNLELEAPPSMELLHDHDQFEPSRSSISSTLLYPGLNGGISTTTTTPPPHDHSTIKMEQNILGRHYANSDNINAWNIIDNSIPTFITSSSTTNYLS